MSALPTPKYAVGDTIYTAGIDRTIEKLPCPDCKATGKWEISSPAGEVFVIDCPRCASGHISMTYLPKLAVEAWHPITKAFVIDGLSVRTNPTDWEPAVQYTSGNNRLPENSVYASEAEAFEHAQGLAVAKNITVSAQPAVMTAKHLSQLTIKTADLDQTWHQRWDAWYAYRDLREKVEEATNSDSGVSASDRLSDLSDEVTWRDRHLPAVGEALKVLRALTPSSAAADEAFALLVPPASPPVPVHIKGDGE